MPVITLTENDYRFLPVEEAVHPAAGGFFRHYVSYWWVVHPEKGLAFFNPPARDGRRRHSGLGAPQCNTAKRISQLVCDSGIPWSAEVRLLESAWVPADISDYAAG
jgi:hypothetical protein